MDNQKSKIDLAAPVRLEREDISPQIEKAMHQVMLDELKAGRKITKRRAVSLVAQVGAEKILEERK